LYVMSSLCQFPQSFFDLVRDAFASRVYAIVCKAASVSFCDEHMNSGIGVFLAEGVSQEVEMVWASPKSDAGSQYSVCWTTWCTACGAGARNVPSVCAYP
jgi:hypothetical protein